MNSQNGQFGKISKNCYEIIDKLYFFNEDNDSWDEIAQLVIYYNLKNIIKREYHDNEENNEENCCKLLTIRQKNNKTGKIEKIFLDYMYNYHYYKKEKMQKVNFYNLSKNSLKNMPKYLLTFSNLISTNPSIIEGFVCIGSNFENSNKIIFQKIMSSLYKKFRFSELGIKDQLRVRIKNLTLLAFKDILRFIAKSYNYEFISVKKFLKKVIK